MMHRKTWFSNATQMPLGASVALLLICCTLQADDRPNIILVMADDQGWGDMAYAGHPVLQTPHFDAAAAAGMRFNRFYAAAPVCSPTRGSVMTGRHPNRYGVFQWGYPIRPQETTVAEVLKSAGYRTAHFGKWHLGSVRKQSPANPGENGFETWLSAPNFFDNDPILSKEGTAVQLSGESSIVTADAAIEWISSVAEGDAPFFAVVWFGSPHAPHRAVDQDREPYRDLPKQRQHFLGEITGMDRAFGKIRQALSDLDVRQNTILWYCSDNGALPNLGSTGGFRGNKGKMYEGGLLVPAILEWPEVVTKPRSLDMRCNTVDIFPTLLELAGVESSPSQPILDGISLAPVLRGDLEHREQGMGFWNYPTQGIGTPSAQWMGELLEAQQAGGDLPPHPTSQVAANLPETPYSTVSFPGHSAWIEDHWKLHRIEQENGEISWELYDLETDPQEANNVIAGETTLAESLRSSLHDWLASVVNSLNGNDY